MVSGIYPPDIGGPANYIPALEAYLNELTVHTTLIALADKPKNSRHKLNEKVFILRNLILPFRFLLTVYKLIQSSQKSNAIFANGLHEETAVANLVLRKKLIMKVVGDPVWEKFRNQSGQDIQNIAEFNSQKLGFKSSLRRKFLTWALNNADVVVCPSLELCGLVTSWGVATQVSYVPNGVEPVIRSFEERPLDVIFVGRLVKWKNVDEIIISVSQLGLSLTVLGDGPERTKLENLARSLNTKVTFEGQVKESHIKDYLIKAKCFVLISDYEGMSFALLQAMNCETVPVVSDIPGNLQIIIHQETGLVVPLHDKEKLQETIAWAINNPRISVNIAKAAKKYCNNEFNLENNFARMMELFTKGI